MSAGAREAVMFDYLDDDGRSPRMVLERQPAPTGRIVAYLDEAWSIVLDLPADLDRLRELRSGRFWKDERRRERRFLEEIGELDFRVVSEPDEVRAILPAVRELFAERWDGLYTSLPWRRSDGFEPYADALVDRARSGRAELVVLEGDGRLLAFSWLFLEPPWCYCWQHASSRRGPYPRYGLGTLLDVRTFRHLISRGDVAHYDFMVGDDAYKRDWESWRRPVYLRIEAPDTALGRVSLHLQLAKHRARHALRDGDPARYEAIKRVLSRLERSAASGPLAHH